MGQIFEKSYDELAADPMINGSCMESTGGHAPPQNFAGMPKVDISVLICSNEKAHLILTKICKRSMHYARCNILHFEHTSQSLQYSLKPVHTTYGVVLSVNGA